MVEPTAADKAAPRTSKGVSGLATSSTAARTRPMGAVTMRAVDVACLRVRSWRSSPSGELSRRSSVSPASSVCHGWRAPARGTDRLPASRPVMPPIVIETSAVALIGNNARRAAVPFGPASAQIPPVDAPPSASKALRRLTSRAERIASTIRHALTSPGPTTRCALHGTGAPSTSTPRPMSANRNGPGSSPATSIVTRPCCCRPRSSSPRRLDANRWSTFKRRASASGPPARNTSQPAACPTLTSSSASGAGSSETATKARRSSPRHRPRTRRPPAPMSRPRRFAPRW